MTPDEAASQATRSLGGVLSWTVETPGYIPDLAVMDTAIAR